MRRLRKQIYKLQESNNPAAKLVLNSALGAYRLLDKAVLKRAERLDRQTEIVYSHDHKFLCVLVPKCGSRTILAGLEKAAKTNNFDLNVKERGASAFVIGYDSFYRFAIVRDPWARAYSCYKQKILQNSPIKQALHFTNRDGLNAGMSFAEFVAWLNTPYGADNRADRHWASQHLILGLDMGFEYTFVGKLENMVEDIGAVANRLGFASDTFVERRNITNGSSNSYLDHYTPDLIAQISARYARDIEEFGYEPPVLSVSD